MTSLHKIDARRWRRRAVALGIASSIAVLAVPAGAASAAKRPRCDGKAPTITAGGVKRVVSGTKRDDVIRGSRHRDRIKVRRGKNSICGGRGRDILRGGRGRDRIFGDGGRDRVRGGNGRAVLRGGRGRDRILADNGTRHRVQGGRGRDRIRARDSARDKIDCGPARDTARIDSRDVLRRCERVTLGAMPNFALPSWSDGLWSDPAEYETIHTGDLDGDGRDELLGRSPFGIEAYRFDTGTGQWLPLYNGADPELTDGKGWTNPSQYSTIQLSDIDGDGGEELLGRESDGLHVWRWDEQKKGFDELPQSAVLDGLSDQEGQTDPAYYSTIQTGDIDGKGGEDVLARVKGDPWALVWWSFVPGDTPPWVAAIPVPVGTNPGLASPSQYSTIQLANLDSDREEELIVRLSDGVHAYELVPGTLTIDWKELPELGQLTDAAGWTKPQYYSTIQTGDVDGEGAEELLARGPDGLHAWHLNPSSGWTELPTLDALSDANHWDQPEYYETIQTADIDGDGTAEVIGRAADGLHAYRLAEGGWQELKPAEGDFSDGAGWDSGRYYSTIQTARVGSGSARDVIGRGLSGVQTFEYSTAQQSWVNPSALFPDYSSGEDLLAYEAINKYIGGQDNPGFDLRQAYADASTTQLDTWQRDDIPAVPQPSGVSDETWNAVKAQLTKELTNAQLVLSWYDDASAGGYLHSLIDDKFLGLSMDTSADLLKFNAQSNAELEMKEWQIFEGVLEGLGALDALSGPAGEVAVVTTSLVGGATTAGLGEPDVDSAIDGVTGKYIALRNRLNSDFQTALDGLGRAKIAIQSDYGLQTAISELIGSNFWQQLTGDPRAIAIAGAEKSYDLNAWKIITPAIWAAVQIGNDKDSNEYYCNQLDYCQYTVGGRKWSLAYGADAAGPGNGVQQSLRDQLTGPISSGCDRDWDLGSCNLGVPIEDVLLGNNGWANVPAWQCTAVFAYGSGWAQGCPTRLR